MLNCLIPMPALNGFSIFDLRCGEGILPLFVSRASRPRVAGKMWRKPSPGGPATHKAETASPQFDNRQFMPWVSAIFILPLSLFLESLPPPVI